MKIAIVTGASEGIGRVFAYRLVQDGYRVIAVARSQDRLECLRQELQERAPFLEPLCADLSQKEGVDRVEQALSSGHVTLLINNAGIGAYGDFATLPYERVEELLSLNIMALTRLSHSFLRQSQAGDALINVSSILAFMPMPISGIYSASKAYVTSLSESLWHQNQARGVYVMGLCPGVTRTEFNRRAGGNSRDIPEFLMESPEELVEHAMRALARRQTPTVVSGVLNGLISSAYRFLPRKWLVNSMARKQPRMAER